MKRMTNRLVKTLQERGLTLALGESVTCGLAAHQLNTVKGTMNVLKGSLVCYHPETKTGLLGISKRLIDTYTAESRQVTEAIATRLPRLFNAEIYAAITGLAAVGGSETKSKPVGTVFMAVRYKGKTHHQKKHFANSPLQVRKNACGALYRFILEVINR